MNYNFIPDLSNKLSEIKAKNEALVLEKELLSRLNPVTPFSEKEMSKERIEFRNKKSDADFWFWDKTYFPPEAYSNYAPPGKVHRDFCTLTAKKDRVAHIIMGSRDIGKTITFKKKFIYDLLHGKRRFMAAAGETLSVPQAFLLDIIIFLDSNQRIKHDYNIHWIERNTESIALTTQMNKQGSYVAPLSLERSSKGRARAITLRFDYIYLTDWENETSSKTKEGREKRIKRINEMRGSLSNDGTLIAEANNFDIATAQNDLIIEKEKGLLSENFKLHIYPAWDKKRPGRYRSIWYSRFPAKSEKEMRKMMQPYDDYDWYGNYQQAPRIKSGDHFPSDNYNEYSELPKDVRAVLYVDPNLSKKGKGDTTAMGALGWSSSTQQYYIILPHCISYSNSNDLLMDFLTIKKVALAPIITCGLDGNVAQESVWDNNIQLFTQIHSFPFPPITFCRYKVDDLVTSVSSDWKRNKFLFPKGFRDTEEGRTFTDQIFSFISKKAGNTDDAPDWLICAYTLLMEEGISFVTGNNKIEVFAVSKNKVKPI